MYNKLQIGLHYSGLSDFRYPNDFWIDFTLYVIRRMIATALRFCRRNWSRKNAESETEPKYRKRLTTSEMGLLPVNCSLCVTFCVATTGVFAYRIFDWKRRAGGARVAIQWSIPAYTYTYAQTDTQTDTHWHADGQTGIQARSWPEGRLSWRYRLS